MSISLSKYKDSFVIAAVLSILLYFRLLFVKCKNFYYSFEEGNLGYFFYQKADIYIVMIIMSP